MLLFLISFGAIFEAVSLGSVVPFLVAMAEPSKIINKANAFMNFLDQKNHLTQENAGIVFGILFITLSLFAGALRILTLWAGLKYSAFVGNDLSSILFNKVLHQPLSFHQKANSSSIIDMLTEKIRLTAININCLINLLSGFTLVLLISCTLLWLSPLTFLLAMSLLGAVYGTVLFFIKNKIVKNGKLISQESVRSIK
ncbi:MAG: ABC transporter ATP-binding protein, partial [Chitinophagia bacterium]|nr:ABC transporter ATP-binding protein [Chitinophagia bacterium]